MAGRLLEAAAGLMVWFHMDDGFSDHPKVWALSDGAYRLHVSGINYCARLLTDGVVPLSIVPRLKPAYRPAQLKELLDAGMWHPDGHTCPSELCQQPGEGAAYVHDYLATNRAREGVLAERAAAAERQRKWREKRRESQRDKAGSNGVTNGSLPNPTRPPSKEGRVGSGGCLTCGGVGYLEDDERQECPTCRRPNLVLPRPA